MASTTHSDSTEAFDHPFTPGDRARDTVNDTEVVVLERHADRAGEHVIPALGGRTVAQVRSNGPFPDDDPVVEVAYADSLDESFGDWTTMEVLSDYLSSQDHLHRTYAMPVSRLSLIQHVDAEASLPDAVEKLTEGDRDSTVGNFVAGYRHPDAEVELLVWEGIETEDGSYHLDGYENAPDRDENDRYVVETISTDEGRQTHEVHFKPTQAEAVAFARKEALIWVV